MGREHAAVRAPRAQLVVHEDVELLVELLLALVSLVVLHLELGLEALGEQRIDRRERLLVELHGVVGRVDVVMAERTVVLSLELLKPPLTQTVLKAHADHLKLRLALVGLVKLTIQLGLQALRDESIDLAQDVRFGLGGLLSHECVVVAEWPKVLRRPVV
eukprot:jgi/Chrpa1/20625/Chrysochromulina_OHIO_Genome00002291-RA